MLFRLYSDEISATIHGRHSDNINIVIQKLYNQTSYLET